MFIKFKFTTTQHVRYSSSSTRVETQLFNLAEVSTSYVLKSLNGKSGIYRWTNTLNKKTAGIYDSAHLIFHGPSVRRKIGVMLVLQ